MTVVPSGLKGEYNHTVDDKGRMIVPSKLREQLGSTFVITRGMDKCLYAYPNDEWEIFEGKLRQLPTLNERTRKLTRAFMGSAVECEVDSQGRINIPKNLRDHVGITKDVTIVGVGDKAEIWSKEVFEDVNGMDSLDLNELAFEISDMGFVI